MSKKKVHLHYQTGPIFRTSVQLSYLDYITSCLVLITLYNIRKNTSYQEEQANIIFFSHILDTPATLLFVPLKNWETYRIVYM